MDPLLVSSARLIAQGLIGPGPEDPVAHLGCVQAQALGGALVSLALRTGTDTAVVRRSLDSGRVVRTWTQRGTIHFAPAADIGWILGLTGERMLKSTAKRREHFGITDAMVERAAELAEAAIRAGGPLSREELLTALAPLEAGEEYGHERHLITSLALRGLIVQGPMAPDRDEMLFVLASEWIPDPVDLDAEAALREWLRRYVTSHGPVTGDDAARWTGLPKTGVRRTLAGLVDEGAIATTMVGERETFLAPDLEDRLADHRAAAEGLLLLPGFDEIILGYKDRSATLAPEHEKAVVPGGNGMFKNTVVDGTRVRGTWKRSPRRSGPRMLVEPFAGESIDLDQVEEFAATHPAFA